MSQTGRVTPASPHRRRAVWAAIVLAVAASLFGAALPAVAGCAYPEDDPRLVELADVVFTGEIIDDRTIQLGTQREVTFRVDRVYKGAAYAEQIVTSDTNNSETLTVAGPGPILVQARYRVEGTTGPDVKVTANGCSGTRPGVAPASLGPGEPPTPGVIDRSNQRTRTLGFVSIGLLCIAGAIWVNRRRGRQTRGA
jgi:hypothetical protein